MLLAIGAPPAQADKRVALVVGNDRYPNLAADQQLKTAVNDSRAVGDALGRLGFDVLRGENLGRQALFDKLDAMAEKLAPGDTAFFFFAGHGVAINGGNYILPSDVPQIEASQEARLTHAALGESDIVSELQQRGVRVAVVVLDACRDNPFKRPGARSIGAERGLGRIEPVQGVFTLYSAGLGQTALDRLGDADRDPNSVFTRVLVPELARPGVDLTALAIDVREEVARLAGTVGHDQRPAYYDETIGGRIYLAGLPAAQPAPTVAPAQAPAAEPAAQAWSAVKDTTSVAVLEDFIRQYGTVPIYGALARERRDALRKSQVAALTPQDATGNFVSHILGRTEVDWTNIFMQSGKTYRPPTLVLFTGRTGIGSNACGLGPSVIGSFYCSRDQKIYLDTEFFDEIASRFGGCSGTACELSEAYVIAHEVGHHVQNLLGILPKVEQQQQAAGNRPGANQLQLRVELQADCLAGVWANRQFLNLLDLGDIDPALRTAAAIGDDTLRKTQGHVVPDSFTHGTSTQRQHWFTNGFKGGSVAGCDTFSAQQL